MTVVVTSHVDNRKKHDDEAYYLDYGYMVGNGRPINVRPMHLTVKDTSRVDKASPAWRDMFLATACCSSIRESGSSDSPTAATYEFPGDQTTGFEDQRREQITWINKGIQAQQ